MIGSVAIRTMVSVFLVSAVPLLVGALLPADEVAVHRRIRWLVCFAIGALLGAAFLHMLPEAFARHDAVRMTAAVTLGGFLMFFVLERYLWAHQHDAAPVTRMRMPPLAALNLLGDGAHNLVDGMAIAAAYLTATSLGIATTVAVLLHELPQEVGDYGVLLHAGLDRRRAVGWNVASGLIALVGALVVLATGRIFGGLAEWLVPFSAGGFIYIAAADLIPQLREDGGQAPGSAPLSAIPLGIALTSLALLFPVR